MKKRALLLGSSLLGLTLLAASAAVAADDIAVDESAAPAAGDVAAPAADSGEAAAPGEEAKDLPRGFYGGTSLGLSIWDAPVNSHLWNATNFTVNDTGTPEDLLWSLFVGYRMTDWLGIELAWTDLGGYTATGTQNIPNATPGPAKTDLDVDGIEARFKVWHNLGLENLSGIGGLGIFFYNSHADSSCSGGCPFGKLEPLDPTKDSGQALTVSAGLQYQITDNVLVRTEYERFFDVDKQDIDSVSVSLVVGFYDYFGQGKPRNGNDMGGIVVE